MAQVYFTINSELAKFADEWSIPSYSALSATPTGVKVVTVTNPQNTNTLNNTISWANNTDNDTYGYRIYRRGPYDSALPTGILLSGTVIRTGNFSFSPGLTENSTYSYAISPTGVNGEGLPTFLSGIFVSTIDPKITNGIVSGYGLPGTLGTGVYFYGLTLWGPVATQETALVFVTSGVFTPKTSSRFSWEAIITGSTNQTTLINNASFNWIPSGYKVYRSPSGTFGANSLLVGGLITGLSTNYFWDNGSSTIAGSPPLTSKIFSGLDIKLDWGFPNNLRASWPLASNSNNITQVSGFNLTNNGAVSFGTVGGRQASGPFPAGKSFTGPPALLTELSTYRAFEISFDFFMSGIAGPCQVAAVGPGPLGNPIYRVIVAPSNRSINYYFQGINLNSAVNIYATGVWNNIKFDYQNGRTTLSLNGTGIFNQAIAATTPFNTTVFAIGLNFASGYISNATLKNLSMSAGVQGYDIYRSDTSSFNFNHLISTINTGLVTSGFIDKGYGQGIGKPIQWIQIADIPYPTNSYVDIGLVKNRSYQYHITSYNPLLIENQA